MAEPVSVAAGLTVRGGLGDLEPVDCDVTVRRGRRCVEVVLGFSGGSEWVIELTDDAAAFLAGLIAAESGVRFG